MSSTESLLKGKTLKLPFLAIERTGDGEKLKYYNALHYPETKNHVIEPVEIVIEDIEILQETNGFVLNGKYVISIGLAHLIANHNPEQVEIKTLDKS